MMTGLNQFKNLLVNKGYNTGAYTLALGALNNAGTKGGIAVSGSKMSEFRFRQDILSADWIDAEYTNQFSPGVFYTVSAGSEAGGAGYVGEFTYSSIGNVSSSTDAGAYTYAETGTTNPHAATQIATTGATTTFTYDSNGNMVVEMGSVEMGSATIYDTIMKWKWGQPPFMIQL